MTNDSTRAFVAGKLPTVSPAPAKDPLNFVDLVVKWLHSWTVTYGNVVDLRTSSYCCFVLCERVAKVAEELSEFKTRPYFRDDTPRDAQGHIYLCSATLQAVFARKLSADNMDAVVTQIAELGLSEHTLIIHNSATKRALWRPAHATDFTAVELGGKGGGQLRPKDFDKELQNFHLKYTSNPQGLALPWKDAKTLQTKDNLEVEIRNWLCVTLRLKYEDSLLVSMESYEPTGRADLKVVFIAERVSYFLELKVFRKVRPVKGKLKQISLTATVKWGKEGIAQAYNYLQANDEVGVAYTCCYDARGKDEDVRDVKNYAEKMKVQYRRYYMFPSTEEMHKALIT